MQLIYMSTQGPLINNSSQKSENKNYSQNSANNKNLLGIKKLLTNFGFENDKLKE